MQKMIILILLIATGWLLRLGTYFEKYIFQDWEFIKYLIIPIILDTFIGCYRAKKQGKFKWKEFSKIIDKLISYITILILTHVMTSFTIDDKTVTIFMWMRLTVFSALMVNEAYSILKNIAALNMGYVPYWLLKKLEQMDKTGKFFTPEEIEENKVKEREFIEEIMKSKPEDIENEEIIKTRKRKKNA